VTGIILHHYETSPFAEKIRVILGYKQLAWQSVAIPVVMPKPDLVALTGGYRKTPVLQLGSDVYCDTPLITRVLDAIAPEPPVFRAGQAATAIAAARWFDRDLFLSVISQLFDPAVRAASADTLGGAEAATAFSEDRRQMMTGTPVRPPRAADGRVIVEQVLSQLNAQLGQGGPFLLGEDPSWVDFCAYHPLWALQRNRVLVSLLDDYPHLLSWLARIRGYGHGTPTPLAASAALEIARSTPPAVPRAMDPLLLSAVKIGDEVEISANDYALEPSVGRLVYAAADELAIERSDERAGTVVVHFPRLGFRLKAHG
jgi:glutathione S-transferase